MILLVHPPVAKPCEPPAGIARLAGALQAHGKACEVLDASHEGLLHLMGQTQSGTDPWTSRAVRQHKQHLDALKARALYQKKDAYRRAVSDVNRLLEVAARSRGVRVSLSNYVHENRSPVRWADLEWAAEHPEENPFYAYFAPRLRAILQNRPITWVGFSVSFLSQALCAWAMMGFLRREFPGARMVVGGGLITSWMQGPLGSAGRGGLIDAWISGPGEGALLKLLGITPAHQTFLPDYASFQSNAYLSPGFILPYSASSGCYWRQCSFCPEKSEGNPYRPLPSSIALAELNALSQKTHPVLIHLLDNALKPGLLNRIAVEGLERPWYGFARLTPPLDDLDFCRALQRAGCIMLKLGLESGDQKVLEALNKGVRLETANRILANLRTAGIAAYVYLIFGTPAEDLAAAQRTLDFVATHHNNITFLNLAIFNLPLYSSEARSLETDPFYEGDLSLYGRFRHPLGWNRGDVRQFLDRSFRRHPAIAPILRQDPLLFTSNHAPLLYLAQRGKLKGER